MRSIRVRNSKGKEIKLSYQAPFILQKHEFNRGVNIYNNKRMNQDGAAYQGNTLGVGILTLQFVVIANDKAEMEKNRRLVDEVFNPKLDELEIIEGGRKLIAIPEDVPYLINQYPLELEGIVDLKVHDPYYLDSVGKKAEIAIWRPSFEFPLDIKSEGIEMGFREPSLIVNILNEGDVSTGVKIVFKANATVVNPSLFNVNAREYFKIEKTLVAGDQVIVTTSFQNKKVKFIQNGITSTLHEWDYQSTFLQLEQGDNLFRYDADDGLDNLSVDVYYTQKYLGV